mmetsp:Transcript_11200/g.22922  ORF Transcript_11200/g.22922 Transcript_11200/m.22922 type:complete len:384 (-) Transcript_11200:171-1322(-)|eukprot:CAMPEP_0172444316 /NCGR_PEP_ID=MMETSP1065-20121228/4377_1 /TAXON_ID=265537 /ORGANISM="Amphiprora paludosa, Strain CCMP125" /LENGTH=383 /DNA_ID=CAMNT_0013194801 /DNA_START=84 /DNA_END=1235 /DNA_ORIENTATION=+
MATRGRQDRIPPALQNVFLQSNRGKEVNKPPPNKAAFKTFPDNWVHQRYAPAASPATGTRRKAHPSPPRRKNTDTRPRMPGERNRVARVAPRRQRSFTGSSPQEHLDNLLKFRGYSLKTYKTLHTAYFNSATKLQMSSYGPRVVEVVRANDIPAMQQFLRAGLSPNPCNLFGESLIHMICRRGDTDMLRALLEHGASVQVSDDFGRTPLHDACWAAVPAFEVVELILRKDPRLLYMKDRRGALPLSYVPRDYWYLWRQFLDDIVDVYCPTSKSHVWDKPPKLCTREPESCPIPDPPNAMPVQLVSLVASGQMTLREARYMIDCGMDRITSTTSGLDGEDYSDDSDYSSDDSDFDSSSDEEDEDEEGDHVGSLMSMVRAWDNKK